MDIRVREIPLSELPGASTSEWADTTRRPYVSGKLAYVPVRNGYAASTTLQTRSRYHGRGYHMIGPVAVVRGDKPSPSEIMRIVEWQHPQGVLWVRAHSGICRVPDTEVLYGYSCDVIHRESGIVYCMDPAKVMFSQGNRTEKARIAGLIKKDERVADMFAGIGYFSLPAARAGGIVHAMEINPVAFGYLQKNIMMNRLSGNIEASCGDSRALLEGVYDRVLMGHFDSLDALPSVLNHVHTGSMLHLHSSGQNPPDVTGILEQAGYKADISVKAVKKTAPRCRHYVQDVTLK